MKAYVLINVQPEKVRQLIVAVARMEGVRHARVCWGVPDIFVELQTTTESKIKEIISNQIQKLEGVEGTETHVVGD